MEHSLVKKLVQQPSSSNNDITVLGNRNIKCDHGALQQLGDSSSVHILELDTLSKDIIARATNGIKHKYAVN